MKITNHNHMDFMVILVLGPSGLDVLTRYRGTILPPGERTLRAVASRVASIPWKYSVFGEAARCTHHQDTGSGGAGIHAHGVQGKCRDSEDLAREVLDIAAAAVRPGITTDEIDAIVHEETIKRGAYPSPLNYREFPKSVCTSVNEVICHGIPDQRKLEEGDIVNLDVTLYYKGFHGDLNETYPVGEISEESKKLIRTTRQCLDAAIAICKPGTLFRDLGKTIEPIARAQGCSVVRNYTGHGIHNLFHCVPNIPHYAKNKSPGIMKPGMCFTIEPMINLGSSWDVDHWPDNWTAVTVDGKKSAQFEETLLITETGVEVLTAGKPREDLK
ncbi:unnamed protein product [Rhizoctonia solani]|uniref:Methionine aminopeptidase n=1 Tax=Rhizoctonia solani TaxID=456999 RepID=A0A8H3AJI8_9AGAM|nr:unnamed protein product [Rhizoctonia solani]